MVKHLVQQRAVFFLPFQSQPIHQCRSSPLGPPHAPTQPSTGSFRTNSDDELKFRLSSRFLSLSVWLHGTHSCTEITHRTAAHRPGANPRKGKDVNLEIVGSTSHVPSLLHPARRLAVTRAGASVPPPASAGMEARCHLPALPSGDQPPQVTSARPAESAPPPCGSAQKA